MGRLQQAVENWCEIYACACTQTTRTQDRSRCIPDHGLSILGHIWLLEPVFTLRRDALQRYFSHQVYDNEAYDAAVMVRGTVVYFGEPRKVPAGRVHQQGTRGFMCEIKNNQFRVRFRELRTSTVHCSPAELKRADTGMTRNLATSEASASKRRLRGNPRRKRTSTWIDG